MSLEPGPLLKRPQPVIHAPRTRRACDKCFSVKERCIWSVGRDICDRCFRLGHLCEIKRPRGKVGRKPRPRAHPTITFFQQNQPPTPENDATTFSVPRSLAMFADLSKTEKHHLFMGLDKAKAYTMLLLGPNFVVPLKQAVLTRLDAAPLLLKDGFLAASGCMILEEGLAVKGLSPELNFRRASSALLTFRTMEVSAPKDLSIYIALAGAAVGFAEFVQGSEIFDICHHALHVVKPVYESQHYYEDHDVSSLASLIFLETTECFFRGLLPTLRFSVRDETFVHRSLGLCLPLLPHFHDLCELNFSLSQTRNPYDPTVTKFLDQIEGEVEHFQPSPPPDFHSVFSPTESTHILAQGRVYSLSLLLLIHRLRYPFGVKDDKATMLSKLVMRELDSTRVLTNQVVKHASFSFIVAAVEMVEEVEREKALAIVPEVIPFSQKSHERLRGILKVLWNIRDTNEDVYWFRFSDLLKQERN